MTLKRPTLLVGIGLSLALAAGCVKKGSGSGSRATRPFFEDQGSIKDDGKGNQAPKPDDPKLQKPDPDKPGDPDDPANPNSPANPNNPNNPNPGVPAMNPEVAAILAKCFGITKLEVQYVVGWDDKAAGVAAANALCAKLASVKYGDGVSNTAAEVAVD